MNAKNSKENPSIERIQKRLQPQGEWGWFYITQYMRFDQYVH